MIRSGFERERGSQKRRVFEAPNAAFGMALTLVAVQEFLGRQLRLSELIGGQDATTLLLNEGLTRR
jgi:hypothetical protein